MKKINGILTLFILIISLWSCSKDSAFEEEEIQPPVESELEIYKPQEFGDMDYEDDSSTWSFDRSRESEHFIIFWDAKYNDLDPGSTSIPEQYRVNIDNLLEKAEVFYDLNSSVILKLFFFFLCVHIFFFIHEVFCVLPSVYIHR